MATLEALRRQVDGARDLQSIVKAMKSISAVRIQQFRRSVLALHDYDRTLELAFQVALRHRTRRSLTLSAPDLPRVAIVFGTDQGLAGEFNMRILEFAASHLRLVGDPGVHVFTVGERAAELLRGEGGSIAERFSVPGSVEGVSRVVQDLLVACETWRGERGVERFTLFYNELRGASSYAPVRAELLPLDPAWLQALRDRRWSGPSLPDHRPEWPTLFRHLVREYLFVRLFQACAGSVASENASRLAAMEAAESRIEERLAALEGRFSAQRQQAITEELLEVVTGFRILEEEWESLASAPSGRAVSDSAR